MIKDKSSFRNEIINKDENLNDSDSLKIQFSGKSIARNTTYNLLGYGIPLIFALILIPPLVRGLGTERFGILSLSWLIIGYFSFFDFGIGKGLTKVFAEKIGLNQTKYISKIFWTSLFLMLSISIIVAIVVSFFLPSIVDLFNISENEYQEALNTFFILIFAVPIVSTTAGLRGVLEAYQKFGIINIIRTFLGAFTFLGPLLVLAITDSLFWIVAFLIFIRIIVWIIYFIQCLKVNNNIRRVIKFDLNAIKPVLKFSIWITIANIVGPLIIYSDRFLIGALISAEAITYYSTPYEIVTKLLLIPGALVGVLFPVFSASFISNPVLSKKIFLRGAKFVFLIIYPAVLIIVTFAYEGMNIWLGKDFALSSSLILQLLSVGILMNSISIIPNNFLQGIGKPKIPTLINLVELPLYLVVMWYSIKTSGTRGAALAYMIMAMIDALTMYIFANRIFKINFQSKITFFLFTFLILGLVIPFLINGIIIKAAYVLLYLTVFFIFIWKYFISEDEKLFFLSKLKRNPINTLE